jgi:hypothetical protein
LRTSRRQLREKIIALLQAGDYPGLTALAAQESGVAAILMQFLYDPGVLLYWRALEGLGVVAGSHPEQVQKLINRLLYLLNEDSGSNGWGAAAALGEIGRGRIDLVKKSSPCLSASWRNPFPKSPCSGAWAFGGSSGGTSP